MSRHWGEDRTTVDARPADLGEWRASPGIELPVTVRLTEVDGGAPVPAATVDVTVGDATYVGLSDGDGGWAVALEVPERGRHRVEVIADDVAVGVAVLLVDRTATDAASPGVVGVAVGGSVTIEVKVAAVTAGSGGPSRPPEAGDGIEVDGYEVSVDGTVVREGDPRLSDARTPLAHTHPASDITGLPAVPGLATDPAEALGTAAAGTSSDAARADHVHPMPDATDVGADPAGTAADLVAGVDTGVLEIVEGTGISVDSTDPKRPIITATGGGGGGGRRLPSAPSGAWLPAVIGVEPGGAAHASTTVHGSEGRSTRLAFMEIDEPLDIDGVSIYVNTPNATGSAHVVFWAADAGPELGPGTLIGYRTVSLATSGERRDTWSIPWALPAPGVWCAVVPHDLDPGGDNPTFWAVAPVAPRIGWSGAPSGNSRAPVMTAGGQNPPGPTPAVSLAVGQLSSRAVAISVRVA